MTWHLPTKANPDYRKDIHPGMQGEVEGFTDEKQSEVLLKVVVNMPHGKGHLKPRRKPTL